MQKHRSEPYLATYLHNIGGQKGLPIGGTFELTARCNFDCPMCYVHLKQQDIAAAGKELTAAQWIDLARQAKDQGMIFVLLTGGEPFVRKDFFEIYDTIKAMGLMVSINTNGSMLEGEIRQRLIDNPPFRMNISLYGGSDDTYRSMCGQSAFDRVVENIRALKAAGIDIRLNLSITPYNQHDLARIYQIAQELQVHVKASSYMYPPIRVNGQQYGCGNRLDPQKAAACMLEWDLLRFTPEEFSLRAQNMHAQSLTDAHDCSMDLDEGVRCRAGHSCFWMTWDGKMLPCGMLPHPKAHPLETGFSAAWEQIKQDTRAIRLPSQCASCSQRQHCFVCAAVCMTETGHFDQKPDYVCQQTKEYVRATLQAHEERSITDHDH